MSRESFAGMRVEVGDGEKFPRGAIVYTSPDGSNIHGAHFAMYGTGAISIPSIYVYPDQPAIETVNASQSRDASMVKEVVGFSVGWVVGLALFIGAVHLRDRITRWLAVRSVRETFRKHRSAAVLETGGVVQSRPFLVGERGCELVEPWRKAWKGTRVTCGSCGAPKWQSEPCEYCGG